MLELIGIPKTKTIKKKIERILQRENSFIAERKKKPRKNKSEGKNDRRKE